MDDQQFAPTDPYLLTFLLRVQSKAVLTANGCLLWSGATNAAGYGVVHFKGKTALAHRAVFEARHGSLHRADVVRSSCCDRDVCPGGSQCPHRRCLSHLVLVVRATCRKGHLLPAPRPGRRRSCANCGRERSREHARRKAKGQADTARAAPTTQSSDSARDLRHLADPEAQERADDQDHQSLRAADHRQDPDEQRLEGRG